MKNLLLFLLIGLCACESEVASEPLTSVQTEEQDSSLKLDPEQIIEPSQSIKDTILWKTYSNAALDFEMDYPDMWSVGDSGFTKERFGLNFRTALDPYEEDCLRQDVSTVQFQYHEMDVSSKDEFVDKLVSDTLEAQSTNSRPSWGGPITRESIQSLHTLDGEEILKVEFNYEPWSAKQLCIGEIPPEVLYFAPYKENWSEFLLILVFNDPDPLVEEAILTLSW